MEIVRSIPDDATSVIVTLLFSGIEAFVLGNTQFMLVRITRKTLGHDEAYSPGEVILKDT